MAAVVGLEAAASQASMRAVATCVVETPLAPGTRRKNSGAAKMATTWASWLKEKTVPMRSMEKCKRCAK